ncbi:unnamed protein product [Ectocarpus sp. CCAP 1310/34]|nr:unnamed protein product [Ectocarpus sp. CCAP 1310/34]
MALVARRVSSNAGPRWRLLGLGKGLPRSVGADRSAASRLAAETFTVRTTALVSPQKCRRGISSTGARKDKVNMTFLEDDGTEIKVEAELGATLLEVAHENDVELEGACGGDLACSTCHVVLPKEYYDKLDEKEEEEDDMLDLAWGLTDTSRLGCQIKVTRDLEGMLIKVPEDSMDMS